MTWKNYLPISVVGAFFLLLAAREQSLLPDVGHNHSFRPNKVSLYALCENLEACEDHATVWDDSMLNLYVPEADWVPEAVAELESHFDQVQLHFVDCILKQRPARNSTNT